MPLSLEIKDNTLVFDSNTRISFQRTLRIPDDGKIYPLPPSFGMFPVKRVDDYLSKVPASWKQHGGVFIPLYQREALWIQFVQIIFNIIFLQSGLISSPKCCKVAIGKVNAINGKSWNQKITAQQDYVVIPTQPWLDGINGGNDELEATIKQFVAMPLGSGHTVEAQVTHKEEFGGIQLMVYDRKQEFKQLPKWQPRKESNTFESELEQLIYAPREKPVPKNVPAFCDILGTAAAYQPSVPVKQQHPPSMNLFAFDAKPKSNEFDDFAFDPIPTVVAQKMPPSQPKAAIMDLFSDSAPVKTTAPKKQAPPALDDLFAFDMPPQQQQQKQNLMFQLQAPKEMGLAAGGQMKQKIYNDPFGFHVWDEQNHARVFVHIVNSAMYYQITGEMPPDTPIDAQAYTSFGMPWHDIYDEHASAVPASSTLQQVKSVKEIDAQKYAWAKQNDNSVNIHKVITTMKQ